ncbi:MAG TPA: hypothetical protein VEA69_15960 [Tepidisphaeraceae bacterium]|nr:hypothetical protein [Tepidisphaeraceae bacterium]
MTSPAGAAKPPVDPPDVRYRTHIQEATDTAGRIRDSANAIEADNARYLAFMRADLAKLREQCEIEAKLYERVAQAYKADDIENVRKHRAEIAIHERRRNVWKVRIGELRLRQAQAAPAEALYVEESRWIPAGAVAALDALIDAKRAAAEAWGRAAEALTPEADPAAATAVRETAYAAEAEREIAQWRFEAVLYRERITPDKTASSPEMARAVERIDAVLAQREKIRRAEVERDRLTRAAERELHDAQRAFREAYEAAVAERARQKAAKR